MHNYLFIRIPLLRPDRFLTLSYPYLRWMFSPLVAALVAAIGLLGLIRAARQWDVFLGTFVDMFSVQGAIGLAGVVHGFGDGWEVRKFIVGD